MVTSQQTTGAVRAAQAILALVDRTLVTDGRWGKFTNGVYTSAPISVRMQVDAVLALTGLSAARLHNEHVIAKKEATPEYVTRKAEARAARGHVQAASAADVEAALINASNQTGVSLPLLKGFMQIESRGRSNATNGSSRGLFQIQPPAWKDASKVVKLGDYNTSWYDPYQNALAGAAYLLNNQRVLRSLGYRGEISPAVLYLAHQQGAGGFMELYKVATGQPVRTNYVTIEKMEKNPPQDGRGVTTNKAEFYQRWMAVAAKKTQF
jgi:hypothetical protein